MKKTMFVLLAFFAFHFNAVAQNYYTVQLGTFQEAQPQDFSALQSLGFVHAVKTDVSLSIIYIGGADNRAVTEKLWQQVRNRGYVNAFIQERSAQEGQAVSVIQLATKNATKPINWQEFAKVSNLLYAMVNGSEVKIVVGTYANATVAKAQLDAIKKAGFKDAFVKNTNTIYLHKLTNFETGIKEPLIPLEFNNTPPNVFQETPPQTTPNEYNVFTPRSGNAATSATVKKVAAPAMPKLYTKLKRRSALNLQTILKQEGYYKGSVDGYYGKGTTDAYAAMKTGNRRLQKYVVLAKEANEAGQSASNSRLQTAINNLADDPAAMTIIKNDNTPIAKAYQAYNMYQLNGVTNEVNRLMNAAIKEAFVGKKMAKQPPFDYRSTYAYDDLTQLLLHLHYIHSAPGNNIMAPCWLMQRHPTEMKAVFARYASVASLDFPLKACDQFLNWEDVRVLHTIAADLNTDKKLNTEELAQASSLRAMLYISPKPMSAADVKSTEDWNTKMIAGLNGWATRDPANQQTVAAFKTAYYQSQVRLEDFFLDKGFQAEAAKSMALIILRTLVEYHLERFV